MSKLIFHLNCPDQQGIIAQFTHILHKNNVNILSLEQHVEKKENLFFMRAYADMDGVEISKDELLKELNLLVQKLSGKLTTHDFSRPLNVAIMCTKEQVHVIDLLMKQKSGELFCNIPIIVSNHKHLYELVEPYGIEYHHLPINPQNKLTQEEKLRELFNKHKIDVVVLARYMQILSPSLVQEYEGRIINIHHAFLPAFKGDRPYHKAWERGVKMIGATAHYVTEDLDEGPIIAQDVESVTHQYSVKEMIQAGRDIERRVLTSAVKAHLHHRILLHGKRTIIFHS